MDKPFLVEEVKTNLLDSWRRLSLARRTINHLGDKAFAAKIHKTMMEVDSLLGEINQKTEG